MRFTPNTIITQFFLFGLVGFSNTLICYVVYSLCIFWGMHYLPSNAIGFIVSVLNAYYWNDRFVFKKKKGETRGAVRTLLKTYLSYGSTSLILASVLLYLYVDKFHISEYIAQLLVLVVTIPLNFIINKFWSFKTRKRRIERENSYYVS